MPGEWRCYLLLAAALDCEDAAMIEVIIRCKCEFISCASIPKDAASLLIRSKSDEHHAIGKINGMPVQEGNRVFHHGDILDVGCSHAIHAGGHHLNPAAPPTLAAFADFTARVEFMCDTHGWVATDEMFHYTQALQWQQDWLRFGTPQLWNVANGDFEPPIFGELNIPNNSTTAIPVLIGSHWAGIEITRQGSDTTVTFIQVSEQLHTPLTFLVARLLDIAPHRFQSPM